MAGDARCVLSTLNEDAVLLSDNGDAPIVGQKAIDNFWWPSGAPPSRLLSFEQTVPGEEIGSALGSCTPDLVTGPIVLDSAALHRALTTRTAIDGWCTSGHSMLDHVGSSFGQRQPDDRLPPPTKKRSNVIQLPPQPQP